MSPVMPPHLDDVWPRHAHASGDEICNTLERIRLLAGRDGAFGGEREIVRQCDRPARQGAVVSDDPLVQGSIRV
jgi:hypothetical protein